MGLFDQIISSIDEVKQTARAGLDTFQRLAEEAQHEILEIPKRAEQAAKDVVEKIIEKIINTAQSMRHDLEKLTPNFDEKLEQIIAQVSEVASAAATEGVDLSELVNAAVEVGFNRLEVALKAAINAINQFLDEAQHKVFRLIEEILPKPFYSLLEQVKVVAQGAVNDLKLFGSDLKSRISMTLEKIKGTIQDLVRNVGEVLGPFWEYIQTLWKLFFGVEPEQCQIAAQWFEERMKRTEKQLLFKRSAEPVSALIKKHTYLELLPPDESAWKTLVLEFLNREDSVPAWRSYQARMKPLLAKINPRPGHMIQLTWDEPFIDELGGQQRVQISVLYFRWRTDEFRKVSSGVLGILAMLSAVDRQGEQYEPPPLKIRRDLPLQMDKASMKKIYDEVAPYMRSKPMESDRDSARLSGSTKVISRQLKFMDDDRIWRSVDIV